MEWFEMTGLTFILIVFVIGVVAIVMRWFRHRERLAMIERGMIPPDAPPQKSAGRRSRGLLIGGIGLAALGLVLLCAALFLALPALTGLSSPLGPVSLGLAHLPGLLVLFMGIALLIAYLAAQPTRERTPSDTPLQAPAELAADAPDAPELRPLVDEYEAKVSQED